jgi:hypothetical protein
METVLVPIVVGRDVVVIGPALHGRRIEIGWVRGLSPSSGFVVVVGA